MDRHCNVPNSDIEIATLVDLLRLRAEQHGERGYTFLVDGEEETVNLPYQKLDRLARAIAARLQQLGLGGERVVLLYPEGLEFVAAFFGCLYAGVVAVPAYPPRFGKPTPRLRAIVNDAQVMAVLTTQTILEKQDSLLHHAPYLQELNWLVSDTISEDLAEDWRSPGVSRDTLAFLQYTSGSTAIPRGVMVSHGNLMHNSALIHRCFEHTPDSLGLTWLPPYHDMGLIGGILQPLYGGFPVVLMSPMHFLQKPVRWLEAISRYQATSSGGPNFAYDLCVQKVAPEQRATLDLGSWSVAFNGAEPVRHHTIKQFSEAFAPCGFRPEAFYPCYGLAEATLLVTGGEKRLTPVARLFGTRALGEGKGEALLSDQAGAQMLVSSGQVADGLEAAIVDPETTIQRPSGEIGEIWVRGPSVAQGYWDRPIEARQTFQAHLQETGKGPFLRTGDLGFLLDKNLFVTGRLKDLIIIRGRNYYPQDIELTAESSHQGLRAGCGAAFGVDIDGVERLVVVQEVKREHRRGNTAEMLAAVRKAIFQQHQLRPYAVVLIRPTTIPKTSSGKIQRHAARASFIDGTLIIIDQWTQGQKDDEAGKTNLFNE
jgi:acyl-CoA synthetase (AMP-forming)/AMP-acid ligase II